jgi:hypothetical protein
MQNDYLEEFLEIFILYLLCIVAIGLRISEAEPIAIPGDQ